MKGTRALGLLLATVAVICAYLVARAPAFEVHEVTVTGLVQLSADRVASEAGVPDGTPLWRVSSANVSARVQADPMVASVRVSKHWPDQLEIAVTERVPIVSVVMPDGRFAEVDATGTVMRVDRALRVDRPLVTGAGTALAPRAVVQSRGLTRAIAVAVAVGTRPSLEVSEIHIAAQDTILVYLSDGTPVDFGVAGEPDRQAAALAGLLEALSKENRQAAYLNVVDPDAPVAKPLVPPAPPSEPATVPGG